MMKNLVRVCEIRSCFKIPANTNRKGGTPPAGSAVTMSKRVLLESRGKLAQYCNVVKESKGSFLFSPWVRGHDRPRGISPARGPWRLHADFARFEQRPANDRERQLCGEGSTLVRTLTT